MRLRGWIRVERARPIAVAAVPHLVIGSTVSRLGNSIAPVALAFAVLDLTGSATSLGIVVGARSLANVIFALLGGVVADRLPRNIILVGSSLAGAVSQGLVAVLVFERVDSVALLAALSAVNGTVSAFALPASVALIPQTVPAEQLVPANAFARMGANAASLLGLPLAGVVVAGLGSDWGIAIDAASFAVAALFFGLVRIPAVERAAPGGRSVLRDLIDGWQAFIARTWLWVVVAAFGVLNMAFAGGVTVLGPVVADETVGRRAWGFVLGAERRIPDRRLVRAAPADAPAAAIRRCLHAAAGLPLFALAATPRCRVAAGVLRVRPGRRAIRGGLADLYAAACATGTLGSLDVLRHGRLVHRHSGRRDRGRSGEPCHRRPSHSGRLRARDRRGGHRDDCQSECAQPARDREGRNRRAVSP